MNERFEEFFKEYVFSPVVIDTEIPLYGSDTYIKSKLLNFIQSEIDLAKIADL